MQALQTLKDFVNMFQENEEENADAVIRELQRITVSWNPDDLPDPQTHSTIKINGSPVSKQCLGLLHLVRKESKKPIPFSVMEELMKTNTEKTKDLELNDEPEFNLSISENDPGASSGGGDLQLTCTVEAEGQENVFMSPSDWSSLLFYRENIAEGCTYKCESEMQMRCEDIPDEVDKAVVAQVLLQTWKLRFDDTALETELVDCLLAEMATCDQPKLEEVWMDEAEVTGDPHATGEFLASVKVVGMGAVEKMSGLHWEGWRREVQRRLEQNTLVLETVILLAQDVAEAEPAVAAGLFSCVPQLQLWWRVKISSGVWALWGGELASRAKDGAGGIQHLTLADVDVGEVGEEELGNVVIRVPEVTLAEVENMGEAHWSVIKARMVERMEGGAKAAGIHTLNLVTDLSHVDSEVVGSVLANLGKVSMGSKLELKVPGVFTQTATTSKVLSSKQWEVFSTQVMQNSRAKKLVLRELDVQQLNAQELEQNKSHIENIKAHISANQEK